MKTINKTSKILKNNSGETMVEVIVAFTLLTIMMLIFSQGLAWATRSEVKASESRNAADNGMMSLQAILASEDTPGDSASDKGSPSGDFDGITRCEYVVNGVTYVVYQPNSN